MRCEDFPASLSTSLRVAGFPPAAAILDAVLTSDGIIDLPADVAQELVKKTHEAGALWIADEVQSGHGRTGAAMWGYQRLGITPDIVTVGKPMGNGHPVAAVITRADLARKFSPEGEFFSTFGGNPVAMAAALAVLEVMNDQRVIENSRAVGAYLGERLRAIAASSSVLGEVRQIGLAIGVDAADGETAQEHCRRDAPTGRPDRHHRPHRQRAQDPAAARLHACTRRSAGRNAQHGSAHLERSRHMRQSATERVGQRFSEAFTRAAPYIVTIDGVLLIIVGLYAAWSAIGSFQGEGMLLVVGGLAIVLFGVMVIGRWNPAAVRTGLIGLTAGYFATALSEFEVATDPCDIGATLDRCVGHVPGGGPWVVYQGPLILGVLLFIFIAFEPLLTKKTETEVTAA